MMETLGSLKTSKNSSKLRPDGFGSASILGVLFITLGGDRMKVNVNIYDLTPEEYEALSSTRYSAKTMKSENDILMTSIYENDLNYTDICDKA